MKRVVKVNKETLNAMLPPIPADFEQDMRNMLFAMPAETGKKGKPMKKKISVGFVLAVVFTLLAASALAAVLLGGKDFVEQIMAPKAVENTSQNFTKEEIAEILKIAEENNLTLSDVDVYRLNHLGESGYSKEELMRRFVKTEYGFYPAAWPIEVQHWYEQLLKACGLDQSVHQINVLPEGDEITEEQAVKIAEAFIHAKYDFNVDLNDKTKYLRFLTYMEHKLGDLQYREWSFSYEAQDLYGTDYSLTLDTAGSIKAEYSVDGILGTSYAMRGQFIEDRFKRVYGDQFGFVNWDSYMLLNYQDALRHREQIEPDSPHILPSEEHILATKYLLPDASFISKEDAIAKAKAACGDLNYETVYSAGEMAVLMKDGDTPIWKVTLQIRGSSPAYAEVNATTGEVLFTLTTQQETTWEWRSFVPESYWAIYKPREGYRAARPETTAAVDGFQYPAFWNSEEMPESYWAALNAIGYNEDTMDEIYTKWIDDYGWNTDFWPLEAQALDYLLHDQNPNGALTHIPGLPRESDLTKEQALEIGKTAFKDEFADEVPTLNVSTLRPAFRYWANDDDKGRCDWQVIFFKEDGSQAGEVYLTADTGEVYELQSADVAGVRHYAVSSDELLVTPAPQENGRPWFWGKDFAPASYWEQLDATMQKYGVTAENIQAKADAWCQEYEDQAFWPHDCKLMYQILALLSPDDLEYPDQPYLYITFPDPAKKSQAEIEEIAWKALHEVGDEQVGADWLNQLRIGSALITPAVYIDGMPHAGTTWFVQFYNYDANYGYWATRASVFITEDGEVIHAELDLYSNG